MVYLESAPHTPHIYLYGVRLLYKEEITCINFTLETAPKFRVILFNLDFLQIEQRTCRAINASNEILYINSLFMSLSQISSCCHASHMFLFGDIQQNYDVDNFKLTCMVHYETGQYAKVARTFWFG